MRSTPREEFKRPAVAAGILGEGTLACPACDAPVSPGPSPVLVGAPLACPWCETSGPVRDFLSMSAPTRPARVLVRVSVSRRPPG